MKLKSIFVCFQNVSPNTPAGDKTQEMLTENNGNQLFQILVALNVGLLSVGFGAADSWSSPALPYLESPNSQIEVTSNQGSWIVSIFNLGAVFGYMLCPFFVDRIGRKYTLLFFALPQIISWVLIIFAKQVSILYVARFISGLGCWASFNITTIYMGEIANKNIRGTLVNIGSVCFNIGAVICVTCGAFVSYDFMNLILLFIPSIFIFTFIFVPESPYFYIKQKNETKAIESLVNLHGKGDPKILELEISRIKQVIIADDSCKKHVLRDLFRNKKLRNAFVIVLLLKIGYVFSGSTPITAYYQEILSYSNFQLAPEYSTMVLQIVILIFSIIASPFSDYFGRRKMILGSGILSALSLGIIGVFFFYKFYLEMNVASFSWIPLVCLIFFNVACSLGVFVIPAILASEVFPMEVKSVALCLIDIVKTFLIFLVKLGFKSSVTSFGLYSVFWAFAFSCFALSLIAFLIMPETKGKTLEQVQILLS